MIIIQGVFLSFFVFATVASCESLGVIWDISDFYLILDDFNPKDTPFPERGELKFSFEERNGKDRDHNFCKIRWKAPNIVNEAPARNHPWYPCGWASFRVRNISTSFPMEFEIDIIDVSQKQNFSLYYAPPEEITTKTVTFKVLANATGQANNWLDCNLHRHDKDVICGLTNRTEPFAVSPKITSGTVEPFVIRNITVRGFTEDPKSNCTVQMSIYSPNGTFFVPGSLPPAEEKSIISSPTEDTCKGLWDCRKVYATGNRISIPCDKSRFAASISYSQDDQLRVKDFRAEISLHRPMGWARMDMASFPASLAPKSAGLPGFCKGDECTWNNISVPVQSLAFNQYGGDDP